MLCSVEVKDGLTAAGLTCGLDLDRDSLTVERNDKVEFPITDPSVPLQQPCATVLEELGSHMLTESADVTGAQIAEVGSSSSMLTSRNVITLTVLTNLAGRYMSHTHASFNSSSK